MQVFYINIGGGEPTDPARTSGTSSSTPSTTASGVKFSTNGSKHRRRRRPAAGHESDYVDVQISIDGADAETNDHGAG